MAEPDPTSASLLVGEAMNLAREPDAGNPPVRFDEREVETEHGMRLLRHSRGNPETDYVEAYPTAPPLDSTRSLFVPFRSNLPISTLPFICSLSTTCTF
jgi:hypothetical protein